MAIADFIKTLADTEGRTGIEGHPGMTAYPMLRPGQGSRWLSVVLDVVEPGGGIDPHYHTGSAFDHAFYVYSGEVIAIVGEEEMKLGPDSIMYFPSETVHGFRVTGDQPARILRLAAAPSGDAIGQIVYLSKH